MTPLANARARRPRLGRLRQHPEFTAALSGLAAFALQLVAGWPGWMLPSTVAQWVQARSGPYSDAFPAGLTWFWAQLDPAGRGPFIPFLLQLFCFWLGVVLLTVGMQPAARWTRFIPLLVLLNPLTWAVVVVSPPIATLSVVTSALGVGSIGLRRFRAGYPTDGRIALLVAAVLLGFAAIGGGVLLWVLVPLLMLLSAALAVAVLPHHIGRRARLETGAKAVLLTFVAALVAAVALPLIVIGNVAPTRGQEAFYALDAFHVDCATTWSTGRITTDPVSPQGLWRGGSAPCNTGSPGDFGDGWTGAADPSTPAVLDVGSWLGIVAAHPGIVIGGRLQHATAMLTAEYPLIPDITGGELVAAPASAGSGEAAGLPSRGGIVLSLAAAVTALLPGAPLLWTVLIPVAVAVWWVRRGRSGEAARRIAMLPLLLWPPLAGLVLGMAVPFDDATVLAPAAVLGWLVALWAVAVAGARFEARDLEVVRYGGSYPGSQPRPGSIAPGAPERRRRRIPAEQVRRLAGLRRSVRLPHIDLRAGRGRAHADADLGPSPLSNYVAEHQAEFDHASQEPLQKVP